MSVGSARGGCMRWAGVGAAVALATLAIVGVPID